MGISFGALVIAPTASSFSIGRGLSTSNILVARQSGRGTRGSTYRLSATVDTEGLFWPSSPKRDIGGAALPRINGDREHEEPHDDDDEYEEERLAGERTLDSVLKVYATHSEPDYLIPWQKRHQTTSTSSGFVLNVPGMGPRIMTNAHSVEYGSVVQVQRRGDAEKHAAVVEAVGNECDLALLRVDSLFPPEESDGKDYADSSDYSLSPMDLGPLPSLQDEVEVLGYPAGGDSLCVTKGVVSRIEMQEYAQAGARLLALQIDAAINPGNSGGPVVNEDLEVVGVAFQGVDDGRIENIGYVVPSSVVRHFLEDVKRNGGRYTGFCHLGVRVAHLENATYRKYLGLDGEGGRKSTGVVVRRIDPISGASGVLQIEDVILSVDGITVGNDGKIPFRRGERVDLGCYVSSLFKGDEANVKIWRDGKEIEVSVPVMPTGFLAPSHFNNKPPPFLVCAGFVFTALSVPYLDAKGAWEEYFSSNISYLQGLVNEPPETDEDEVVVLAQVLAHRTNLGYENFVDMHLLKLNGTKVKCLRHLQELIKESTGPYMTMEFAPEEGGRLVVLDRESCEEVTAEVCEEHSISKPFVLYDVEAK